MQSQRSVVKLLKRSFSRQRNKIFNSKANLTILAFQGDRREQADTQASVHEKYCPQGQERHRQYWKSIKWTCVSGRNAHVKQSLYTLFQRIDTSKKVRERVEEGWREGMAS